MNFLFFPNTINRLIHLLLIVFLCCAVMPLQAAAPTDITLSANIVAESKPSNTTVGTLTSTPSGTYTYTLVSGTGSTDNGSFNISGTTLRTSVIFNFEVKSTYSIRISSTNVDGSFEKVFTITISDVTEEPTDITLSKNNIDENSPASTDVGTFSTSDVTANDTFTYSLVSGTGSTDNGSFYIQGSTLYTHYNAVFDFETKTTYYVRIRTTDGTNYVYEEYFMITVNDVNEAPSEITLSANKVAENMNIDTLVGRFSSTDQDANSTFVYTLEAGTGGNDNASFVINGNNLNTAESFDFETKSSYTIFVRTTDQLGLYFEKSFTIKVTNVNETPTDITLTPNTITENYNIRSQVGLMTTTDVDANNTFIYTFVKDVLPNDNALFEIYYNRILTKVVFDYETKSSYTIMVRATDQGGLYYERTLDITVIDANDIPVANNDIYSTPQDVILTVPVNGVLINDTDADANPVNTLTAVIETNTLHGIVVLNTDGSFTYTPQAGFTGVDSFTYKTNDGLANSNIAKVDIYVNGPPVAKNDSDITQVYSNLNLALPITDNSTTSSVFTVVGAGNIQNMTVKVNITHAYDADLTLTLVAPDGTRAILSKNFGGAGKNYIDTVFDDSSSVSISTGIAPFTGKYRPYYPLSILAGKAVSGDWTLEVSDNSAGDLGVLNGWTLTFINPFTVSQNTSLTIDAPGVLVNDVKSNSGNYANPDPLTAIKVTDPIHGAVTLNSDGSFTYTPIADYIGADYFTYKANDGIFDSNIANVYIMVLKSTVNNAPVASADSYSTDEDTALSVTAPGVLLNDNDINNDDITASLVTNVVHGQLTFNSDGSFIYTPAVNYTGPDSFTYHAFDGNVYSNTVTVDLTVNAVNDAPIYITLSASSITEDKPSGTTVGTFTTIDYDAGDTFTYTLILGTGGTDNSAFVINGNSLQTNTDLNYEAKSVYYIRVRTTDIAGRFYDKAFVITVTNVNDAPTSLILSSNVISDNKPIGTNIGVFSSNDPDGDKTFTYALVQGIGSTDNSCFAISGNILKSAILFDYTSTTEYSIRVQTMDASGLTLEQVFTILITAEPVISLPSSASVTTTGAVLGAFINDNGGNTITGAGIAYGLTADPTTAGSKLPTNTIAGAFTATAANLVPNTAYHFRGYAINSAGTAYTSDVSFITLPNAPVAISSSYISYDGFMARWNAPAIGGIAVPFTYTLELATDSAFTNIAATYTGISTTTKLLTGLTSGASYFYRVRAVNATGASANSNTSYAILPYKITASSGANGSVAPSGIYSISYANSISFTAVPNNGYRVYAWLVDDVKVQDGGLTYTLSNITANHTVQVAFAAIPLPVITGFTPTSGGTGTLVTVTGTDFSGATAVSIGNTAVQFTVVSSTTITLTVPSAAASGSISVTTPVGKVYSTNAFSVPLTSVSLVASPAQQCAVGKSVTLTAAAVGGTSVQYKFLAGTTILQDFSAQNSYTWTPATAGTYQIVAVAKDISETVVYNPQNYVVTPPLTAATLVTSPIGYALFGTPVTLTATATGGASLQYKFMNGAVIMRNFAAGNTFTWTPALKKIYSLTVIVRDMNALNPAATVTSPVTNLTTVAALSAVTLTTTPATSSVYGSPVTLTATSTGGLSVQYKFMNGTTLMRDFAASNTFTWTPASMRTYPLTVIARDVKGANVNATVTSAPAYLTVNAPLTAVSLAMTPSNTVAFGSQVTLSATRTGGAAVQYKFMVGTTTLRDFSTSSTAVWTPSYVKTYTQIVVIARDMNSANPAATVYSTALSLTVKPVLTAVNIYTAPLSTASFGSTVTIYAGATNGASPQYKFMADGNILRDFSAVNNFAWTPTAPGTYQLTAVVRDVNSNTPNAEISSTASSFIVTEDASVNPVDMAKMVFIPGNTFTMGGITTYDTPAHSVSLSGYWIYKYEVTIAQYRAFCIVTNRALPAFPANYSWKGKTGWADQALQQHPMVNVSWADAKAYADWAGVELPTEAQWEYAARGSAGNNYPWGGTAAANDLYNGYDAAKSAVYSNSSAVGISTWAVGSFPAGASWSGAQDMAGNVWEWCGDWYAAYSNTPATDPTGPETGTYRILRGGSWANYGENYTRTTLRNKNAPTITATSIGFRCAKKMVD